MNVIDTYYPLLTNDELLEAAEQFKGELVRSLSNQPSSLPCILNPVTRMQAKAGFGVAVSIGGTNGYVSAFRIAKSGQIQFLNRQLFILPEKTTKDALFRRIADNMFAAAGNRKGPFPVGIGLAYPLRPILHHGFIDGELLSMSKERNIAGLVGKRVGQEFHRFLIETFGMDTTVALANDAICLLLGGNGADLAGVVGTGLNFAYWEKRANIAPLKLTQLSGFAQSEVAINIESAEFDKLPETLLRKKVDAKSRASAGSALAEKETAGAFLYQIFNAGKDGIIGRNFPRLTSTDQINDILTGAFPYPSGTTKQQKDSARQFAHRIFERSSQITAIQICGILMKIGKTKGIVPVVMEGGIFWKAQNYNTLVNAYVNAILPQVIPSYARIFGSSRRGIAILAMSGMENGTRS